MWQEELGNRVSLLFKNYTNNMWLLIHEQTNRVLDIQEKPFEVAQGMVWVEDTSITDRSKAANFTYDRQNKQFTELPKPPEPRDLAAEKIATLETRLQELETKGTKEPILGVGEIQAQDQGFNPLYLLLIPVVVGAYFLGKKI